MWFEGDLALYRLGKVIGQEVGFTHVIHTFRAWSVVMQLL